jgi:hypothetical protein
VKDCKLTTDQRKLNGKRKIRSPVFIAFVAADIENYQPIMVRELLLAHGVSKTPSTACSRRI